MKHLLVPADGGADPGRRQVVHRRQGAERGDEAGERGGGVAREQAARGGDVGRRKHPAGDRFAVPEPAVPARGFDGVPYRMPEVERAPEAPLALVRRDDRRLDPTRFADDGDERRDLALDDRPEVAAHPLEQLAARDDAVLDDFVQSGPELAPGERVEQLRVGDDHDWLVERPDQVLAQRMVDADLAADRAVDLGQQGGRRLDQPHAAQQGRRRETGHVAHHAAPERHDRGAAVGSSLDQRAVEPVDGAQRLRPLAVRHQQRLRAPERPLYRRPVQLPDPGAGDDEPPPAAARLRHEPIEAAQEAAPDVHPVGARCGPYVDPVVHQERRRRSRPGGLRPVG